MSRRQKFRIPLKTGDRVLTEGVIDKNARHFFTHGPCQDLAVALGERTGWPIITVDHDQLLDDCTDAFRRGEMNYRQARRLLGGSPDHHSGVLTPDGRVLDIEGLHDRAAWVERWSLPGARVKVEETSDELPDWFLAGMERSRARTFVDAVLALLPERPT